MFSFLARIVEFLIFIALIRSLVGFVQRLWYGNRIPRPSFRPPPQQQPAGATTLQQDPVCGTYVSVESSLKKLVGGRVVHFCSPECRNRYQV